MRKKIDAWKKVEKKYFKKTGRKMCEKKNTYKFLFLKRKIINQIGLSMEDEDNKVKSLFKAVYTALGK